MGIFSPIRSSYYIQKVEAIRNFEFAFDSTLYTNSNN